MPMPVIEAYKPKKMTASGAVFSDSGSLAVFFCTTDGNLSLENGTDGAGTEVVPQFSVVGGTCYLLPFTFGSGCYANLGGGAAGTFGYMA